MAEIQQPIAIGKVEKAASYGVEAALNVALEELRLAGLLVFVQGPPTLVSIPGNRLDMS